MVIAKVRPVNLSPVFVAVPVFCTSLKKELEKWTQKDDFRKRTHNVQLLLTQIATNRKINSTAYMECDGGGL